MLAKYEKRTYISDESIWIGKYKNLHNISHWHTENELIVCEHGKAKVMIDDSLFNIEAGQCFFCPSESVHFIDADEDSILLVCLYDKKILQNITSSYRLINPVFEDNYLVLQRLSSIYEELRNRPPFFIERTCCMISQLIIDIFRNEDFETASPVSAGSLTMYKKLLNLIEKNIDSISFQEASSFMCLSDAYFSKYFKKLSGMTFSQYLNMVRIEKAVNLIKSNRNLKITDVMLKCGFNTIRNFNRTFKDITGYSPSHMPEDYTLCIRSLPTIQEDFDPTLQSSVLL